MKQAHWRTGIAVPAALALQGCDQANAPLPGAEPQGGAAASEEMALEQMDGAAALIGDRAIWNGRTTLGGVWVAHPDVTEPRQVRIIDRSSGAEVTGALFRRRAPADNAPIQLSSDAAAALNLAPDVSVDLLVLPLTLPQQSEM